MVNNITAIPRGLNTIYLPPDLRTFFNVSISLEDFGSSITRSSAFFISLHLSSALEMLLQSLTMLPLPTPMVCTCISARVGFTSLMESMVANSVAEEPNLTHTTHQGGG